MAVDVDKKFLLRKSTGDSALAAGSELPGLILKGQCKPSDFLFDYELGQWFRLGDHPAMAELFAAKLATPPERRLIYVLSIASSTSIAGPYSTTEIRQRMDLREFCDSSWVFVDRKSTRLNSSH